MPTELSRRNFTLGMLGGAAGLLIPRRAGAQRATPSGTLVLYDRTGPYAALGEQYALMAANLAGRFGRRLMAPVATYRRGDIEPFAATVYVGSTFDEPLPVEFLDDVLAGTRPVLWLFDNIWQLTARYEAQVGERFANGFGWEWTPIEATPVTAVRYRGVDLSRDAANGAGLVGITVRRPEVAHVLAVARRKSARDAVWAVRSANLTYVAELPFSYVAERDRYLAVADLFYDLLAPQTAARHRALVRLEDVSANTDPGNIRACTDTLRAEGVPFALTVIPRFMDPYGVLSGGVPRDLPLSSNRQLVDALNYATANGGTVVQHGYTHQAGRINNPYGGVSGDDYEFIAAHLDAFDTLVLDGSLPNETWGWARQRLRSGLEELRAAGFPKPSLVTPPHYAATPAAYSAMRWTFAGRYDRAMLFGTVPPRGTAPLIGQFFPYPVVDVYGSKVVPENLGSEELGTPDRAGRSPDDLIAAAAANLAVRDGVASFFWHPHLARHPRAGTDHLRAIVRGIAALGYEFVPADSMLAELDGSLPALRS